MLPLQLPPLGLQLVAELGAGAAVAVLMLELAWSLATLHACGVVAEVEAAVEAVAVAAAVGVDHGEGAASAWCAIDEDCELLAAEGLVLPAEAALCGGACPAGHQGRS